MLTIEPYEPTTMSWNEWLFRYTVGLRDESIRQRQGRKPKRARYVTVSFNLEKTDSAHLSKVGLLVGP
jgi:hypothetical protein